MNRRSLLSIFPFSLAAPLFAGRAKAALPKPTDNRPPWRAIETPKRDAAELTSPASIHAAMQGIAEDMTEALRILLGEGSPDVRYWHINIEGINPEGNKGYFRVHYGKSPGPIILPSGAKVYGLPPVTVLQPKNP